MKTNIVVVRLRNYGMLFMLTYVSVHTVLLRFRASMHVRIMDKIIVEGTCRRHCDEIRSIFAAFGTGLDCDHAVSKFVAIPSFRHNCLHEDNTSHQGKVMRHTDVILDHGTGRLVSLLALLETESN